MNAEKEQDFEQELGVTEHRAARGAEVLIKAYFQRYEFPHRDEHNVLRLGWNRPIEKRAQPEQVAESHLRQDLARIRRVLHFRVASLQALAPISEQRLSVLYAIADILEPEYVESWGPLWKAMEVSDWPAVMQELLRCNWNGLVGASDSKKDLFARLITALIADAKPAGLS